ncbi:MAG TPA: hypothetical protein VGM93_10610, partial [Acidimicrobiales bacterium]
MTLGFAAWLLMLGIGAAIVARLVAQSWAGAFALTTALVGAEAVTLVTWGGALFDLSPATLLPGAAVVLAAALAATARVALERPPVRWRSGGWPALAGAAAVIVAIALATAVGCGRDPDLAAGWVRTGHVPSRPLWGIGSLRSGRELLAGAAAFGGAAPARLVGAWMSVSAA